MKYFINKTTKNMDIIQQQRSSLLESLLKPDALVRINNAHYPVCSQVLSTISVFKSMIADTVPELYGNGVIQELHGDLPIIYSCSTDDLFFCTKNVFMYLHDYIRFKIGYPHFDPKLTDTQDQINYILLVHHFIDAPSYHEFVQDILFNDAFWYDLANYTHIDTTKFFDLKTREYAITKIHKTRFNIEPDICKFYKITWGYTHDIYDRGKSTMISYYKDTLYIYRKKNHTIYTMYFRKGYYFLRSFRKISKSVIFTENIPNNTLNFKCISETHDPNLITCDSKGYLSLHTYGFTFVYPLVCGRSFDRSYCLRQQLFGDVYEDVYLMRIYKK